MIEKTELISTLERFKTCADEVYIKQEKNATVKVVVSSTQPTDGAHWIQPQS